MDGPNQSEFEPLESLAQVRLVLSQFREDTGRSLSDLAREVGQVHAWLLERERFWEAEVKRLRQAVATATGELDRCRTQVFVDPSGHTYSNPCHTEQVTLARVQVQLRRAEAELQNTKHWHDRVDEATSRFLCQGNRLLDFLTGTIDNFESDWIDD